MRSFTSVASVDVQPFGRLPSGESAQLFVLRRDDGMEAAITDYGAALTRLCLPTADEGRVDVVLGFDNVAAYARHPSYFGAIAGRVAGRIPRGRFSLGDRDFELATNHSPNHLHAGVCLECEGYPDGVNHPAIDDILVRPGRPASRRTRYVFPQL